MMQHPLCKIEWPTVTTAGARVSSDACHASPCVMPLPDVGSACKAQCLGWLLPGVTCKGPYPCIHYSPSCGFQMQCWVSGDAKIEGGATIPTPSPSLTPPPVPFIQGWVRLMKAWLLWSTWAGGWEVDGCEDQSNTPSHCSHAIWCRDVCMVD